MFSFSQAFQAAFSGLLLIARRACLLAEEIAVMQGWLACAHAQFRR
jgi:hypothetical protein